MSRPLKEGLDYFPLDVSYFNSKSIKLLVAEFGAVARLVHLRLLCDIYEKGYFITWDKDQAMLLATEIGNGLTFQQVQSIVDSCLMREVFDLAIFEKHKILTSGRIQNTYLEAVKSNKRRCTEINPRYDLSKKAEVNSAILSRKQGFTQELTKLTTSESAQIKGKEIKGKESTEYTFFAENEAYLNRLFGEHGLSDRRVLCISIRLPPPGDIQKTWGQSFNSHLALQRKTHPVYENWLSHFSRWLPLNLDKLKIQTPASDQPKKFKIAQ